MNARQRLLVCLSLCGLLLNVLLFYWKLAGTDAVAGCGAGGCAEVMASRWSQVLGVPLAGFGIGIYVLLYAALLWRWEGLAGYCHAAIGGTALWLVTVQAMFLKQFCPWCMAAHAVGCVVVFLGLTAADWEREFRHGLQAGMTAVLMLALAQVYGPVPATHRIEEGTESVAAAIHERGKGRKIAFDGGRKTYDVSAFPLMGKPDAKHVLVEYFDFQCPACRTMRGYLSALVATHPDEVAVILLPVPLDHGCNAALPSGEASHPGSCALAKIALAVWRVKPEVYPIVHGRFMSDPPLDESAALAFARGQTGSAPLDETLRDPWIGELIRANIADWTALSAKTPNLPKLMIHDRRILHGLPSGEAEFIRVMEEELGLRKRD